MEGWSLPAEVASWGLGGTGAQSVIQNSYVATPASKTLEYNCIWRQSPQRDEILLDEVIWCPYVKKRSGQRHTQRDDHMRIWKKTTCTNQGARGLRRSQPPSRALLSRVSRGEKKPTPSARLASLLSSVLTTNPTLGCSEKWRW